MRVMDAPSLARKGTRDAQSPDSIDFFGCGKRCHDVAKNDPKSSPFEGQTSQASAVQPT